MAPSTEAKVSAAEALKEGSEAYDRKDYAEAMRWYRKAADQGNAAAQNNIGGCTRMAGAWRRTTPRRCAGIARRPTRDMPSRSTASAGCTQNGRGVAQDYAEAMRWYRKAADQGNAVAQYNLGGLYENGRGVAQDYAEAMRWYRKAADQGIRRRAVQPRRCTRMAGAWRRTTPRRCAGIARPPTRDMPPPRTTSAGCTRMAGAWRRTDAEAMRWYRKAADQGNAIAQYNLGWMYENGRGVVQDDAEAMQWYRKAADQGYAAAQYNIGYSVCQCLVCRETRILREYGCRRLLPVTTTTKKWLALH